MLSNTPDLHPLFYFIHFSKREVALIVLSMVIFAGCGKEENSPPPPTEEKDDGMVTVPEEFLMDLAKAGGGINLQDQIEVGMTLEELLFVLGSPDSEASLGDKSIYRYPEVEVTIQNHTVTGLKWRDSETERKIAYDRALRIQREQNGVIAIQTPSRKSTSSIYNSSKQTGQELRQSQRVRLDYDIRNEQRILDRYNNQSGLSIESIRGEVDERFLVTDERAKLAQQRIQRWKEELRKLR